MGGYIFGAPVGDMGWFASVLMAVASGMAAFFAATFAGIMSILFWNAAGHKADFTVSYRWVGLPVGLAVMALAMVYLGMLWMRRIARQQ